MHCALSVWGSSCNHFYVEKVLNVMRSNAEVKKCWKAVTRCHSYIFSALRVFQIKSEHRDSLNAAAQWTITLHVLQKESPVSGPHGGKLTIQLLEQYTSCADATLLWRGCSLFPFIYFYQNVSNRAASEQKLLSWRTNTCWLHITKIRIESSRIKNASDFFHKLICLGALSPSEIP